MKIVITGGGGFIGSFFCQRLLAQGHVLVSYDLAPPTSVLSGVEYIEGDIRDTKRLSSVFSGSDRVLHLAAAHHDFGIDSETFETVNVGGAKAICQALNQNGIKSVCFFSSVAVYGTGKGGCTENDSPVAESEYGKTKLAAESVFRQWQSSTEQAKCLIIRPTVTFGPGNFANMYTLINQIARGRYLRVGDGMNLKSLAFVDNIVDATLDAWDRVQGEAISLFNYVDKPDLTSGQIADIIYQELQKKPPRITIPYPIARLLALPFDLFIAITKVNLPISGSRIKKFAQSETMFPANLIRENGYVQKTSLEDGIRSMVRWYMSLSESERKNSARRIIPTKAVQSRE